MNRHDWTPLKEAVLNAENILIYTHVNMDGDAVGSACALCLALRRLGKQAYVLKEDNIPTFLAFLDPGCFVDDAPFKHDLSVAVDIGDDKRLENRKDSFYSAPVRICIDHHIARETWQSISVVDDRAAASALLCFEFIKQLDIDIDKTIAELLYAGILTDTGAFKYEAVDAECFRAAAELCELGADTYGLSTMLFDNVDIRSLNVEAIALKNAKLIAGGRAVVSFVSQADLKNAGADEEHAETSIDRLRIIKGVELAALIKEKQNGCKLSLRSKDYFNVRDIAALFGGGGHIHASGASLACGVEEAFETVCATIEKALSDQ